MLRKIALAEHVLSPGLTDYWLPSVATLDRTAADILFRRLTDLGESRLEAMVQAGIQQAVLSVAGPGVQAEPVIATAVRRAIEANDFLAREIASVRLALSDVVTGEELRDELSELNETLERLHLRLETISVTTHETAS